MGQVGLHGLTGLVIGEALVAPLVQERIPRRAIMFGFVLGNMVPDLDFLAVVSMYPIDHELAMHLHRGFSHSLLAAVSMIVGFWTAALLMKDPYMRYLGLGLGLGIVGHFTLDLLIWFAPVDIFWPASLFGIIPPMNLWWWWKEPMLIGRLLGAAEFAAFAIYFDHLCRLAMAFETNLDVIPAARRMATLCWLTWAVLTALSVDLPPSTYELGIYVPMGIVFMPSCFYLTWRMQTTIEFLGIFGNPQS